jgi:F-type H+-transporting ATPase subunit epsilon
MLEVQPHIVTILADTAARAKDLDEAAALAAKQRAEQVLKDRKGDIDLAQAEAELIEAIAQIKAIQSLRKKTGR